MPSKNISQKLNGPDRNFISGLTDTTWSDALAWTFIGFASVWFYANLNLAPGINIEYGPITWLLNLSSSVGIVFPEWLDWVVQVPSVLSSAEIAGLVALLPILAAVMATCYAGVQNNSGVIITGVFSLLLAIEASGNLLPVVVSILWSSIPVAIALVVAFYQVSSKRDVEHTAYAYITPVVAGKYVGQTLGFYLLAILAPLVLLTHLVRIYAHELQDDPAEELTLQALEELTANQKPLKDADPAMLVRSLAGLSVHSGCGDNERRSMARRMKYRMEGPSGARIRQPRISSYNLQP